MLTFTEEQKALRRRSRGARILLWLLRGERLTIHGVTYAMGDGYRVCSVGKRIAPRWVFVNRSTGEERDAYGPDGQEVELPDRGAGWTLGQTTDVTGEILLNDFQLNSVPTLIAWAESLSDDVWSALIAQVSLQGINRARHTVQEDHDGRHA